MNAICKETMGAHIRNMLTPYANLIQLIHDYKETKNAKYLTCIMKIIDNCDSNLADFIELSHCKEIEEINWRDTNLFKEQNNL